MKCLIYGVNFHNKGAELMQHAVNHQIQQWDRNNVCCLSFRKGTFKQRNNSKISHLLWHEPTKIPLLNQTLAVTASLTPKNIRHKYNIVMESEVDAILDASGFSYSDQWAVENTEFAAEKFYKWKKQGKKIILLPQAFGPFTSQRIREAFGQIIEIADLIYARDKLSQYYVRELSNTAENIRIAPDFTNLVSGIMPKKSSDLEGRPCIIPNNRMIDKTEKNIGYKYTSFLVNIINYLFEKDMQPFVLIHEISDIKIALEIKEKVEHPIQLIQETDPLFLKGIIGKSKFVIGSRFHGLVSGLSQGIPCIGTGWSHKYQMLFRDYNCSNLLIEKYDESNVEILDLLTTRQSYDKIIAKIRSSAQSQKELTSQMWSEVHSHLLT